MEFACSFVPKLTGAPAVQIRLTQTSRAGWRLKQQSNQTRSFRTSTSFFRGPPGGAPTKVRGQRKVFDSVDEAVADIKSGSTILSAGFGLCGTAETIIGALAKRGPESLHLLTAVSNNAGTAIGGGLSPLITGGQVSKALGSFLGNNKALEKKYLNGEIATELTPQGTLAEKLRCGGAGIPNPQRLKGGEVIEPGVARETRIFDGRIYNMETAIHGDVAILRAHKVDEAGNCQFRYTTQSFDPLMAKAAKISIVEAEHIVPVGELKPHEIDLPGVFIDRIVQATAEKIIEVKSLRSNEDPEEQGKNNPALARRNRIDKRAAKELKPGFYLVPAARRQRLDPVRERDPSVFHSSESFGMIRGGHIDVSMLGALQVGPNGDLANYMIPGKVFKGMGGAMDLVSNPDETKIVVLTDHVDKSGKPKIVQHCTLPLTGARVVSTIITDLAVFDVDRKKGGLTLIELAPGGELDEVKSKTGATFEVAENLGRME
ncbi:hypothetical protein LTR74_016531 [Friedmanniomyces endolithicus]|nr:hypothetical protein LTR74_016531 [Friedmanniomyces endolithicus]